MQRTSRRGDRIARTSETVCRDLREVRRTRAIDAEDFFTNHLLPRVPVVVTDAAAEWTAFRKWTWTWLVSAYGNETVLVSTPRREKVQVRLSDYIDYVVEPGRYQMADGPLYLSDLGLHELPELAHDYATPYFVDDWFHGFPAGTRPPFSWIFIGPTGTGSSLHVDTSGTHAWLTQIHGCKEWRLFRPGDLPASYCGAVDAFAVDPERFPAVADASCYTARLSPGETIFVPYGWPHQVRNIGATWAVTENFFNATNVADVCRDTVESGIRSILDEVSAEKARGLHGGGSERIARVQSELLHAYFTDRERELVDRLAAIREVKESLVRRV